MSKSHAVRVEEFRAIARLSHECRDLGDDNAAWQRHFLDGLARLVSADLAVAGELRGLRAGRPEPATPGATTVEWGFENGFDRRGWVRALDLLETDPSYSASLNEFIGRGAIGSAVTLSELVPEASWRSSLEYDEVHRVVGVECAVVCFQPVGHPATDEVYGSYLFRAAGRPDFSGREPLVIREAFAALTPLLGGPLARAAEPSPASLQPRVRDVLRCLLEGDGAKQIAARLDIGENTVNQYTKAIFRHFGVSSRAELLARWLRRGWGTRFGWAGA